MATLADLWLGRPTREQLGGTLLVVPLLTFYFFVVVFGLNLSDIRSEYALLFVFAVLTLLIYDNAMGKSKSFQVPNYTVRKAVVPIMLGVVIVLFPFVAYAWLSGTPFTNNSFGSNLQVFITEVLAVAVVEEFYFRFVLTKIYGGIIPQILFAFSHPAVRNVILQDPGAAVLPIAYFLTFGLIFQQIVFMGTASNVPASWRPFFGLPLSTGLHGAYNTLVILFPTLTVFGMQVSPFSIGVVPVAILGIALIGIVFYRRFRA